MTVSIKRGPAAALLPRPHIFLHEGYYRVTGWNHVISCLGLWRDANTFADRMNNERDTRVGLVGIAA